MSELNIPVNFFEQAIEGLMNTSFAIDAIQSASPEAKEAVNTFMSAMQKYIETGESDGYIMPQYTLCQNLKRSTIFECLHVRAEAKILFKNILQSYFGETDLPFNESCTELYLEANNRQIYSNPKRLTFIQNWKPL